MLLGIDIGGTLTKIGLFSREFELIKKYELDSRLPGNEVPIENIINPPYPPFSKGERDEALPPISKGENDNSKGYESSVKNIIDFIAANILSEHKIQAIGIGVPGVVDNEGILLNAPNLPGWVNINLKAEFSKELKTLGKDSIFAKDGIFVPIIVENDANVAAIAEMELGAGSDVSNFLYVTLGTGIGGAIILNKQLFRGENGGAGEIGHIIIKLDADADDFKFPWRAGCMEEYAAKDGIINIAKEVMEKHPDSILYDYALLDVVNISDAAFRNDAAAVECLTEAGKLIGIGLSSALNILGIYNVIIGGGISRCHDSLYDSITNIIKTRAIPSVAERLDVRKAKFLHKAGIMGAAILAKRVL